MTCYTTLANLIRPKKYPKSTQKTTLIISPPLWRLQLHHHCPQPRSWNPRVPDPQPPALRLLCLPLFAVTWVLVIGNWWVRLQSGYDCKEDGEPGTVWRRQPYLNTFSSVENQNGVWRHQTGGERAPHWAPRPTRAALLLQLIERKWCQILFFLFQLSCQAVFTTPYSFKVLKF